MKRPLGSIPLARVAGGSLAPVMLALAAQAGPAEVGMQQVPAPDRPEVAQTAKEAAGSAAGLDEAGREALVSAGAPIGEGRRTAEASPDVSTRADGRAVSVTAVGGRDRCEPGTPAAATPLCRRRIEARAGEFGQAGAAPMTAEARLLILTDPGNAPQSPAETVRRLGSSLPLDALTGSAAGQLAGALDSGRAAPSSSTPPPAGVVTTPR